MHICWVGGQGFRSNIMNEFKITKTQPFNIKAMDHMTRLNDTYPIKLIDNSNEGNDVFDGKNEESYKWGEIGTTAQLMNIIIIQDDVGTKL